MLQSRENVHVILLPRNAAQRAMYLGRERVIVPAAPLDGANLIAASDLVISAGGTINREAAAVGVPAASIYAGRWAAVDEEVVREERLQRISTIEDLQKLSIKKRPPISPRRSVEVMEEVVRLIFE
jgi:predicted glycosyltransferase